MKLYLEQIWKAAKEMDYDKVRQILNMRLFTYREAQLFCESFKQDFEASRYIKKQATCKCGAIVNEWKFNTTPICANCYFKKSLEKIEYGNSELTIKETVQK